MSTLENRCVILANRPKGVPGPKFFKIETAEAPEPVDGEFLIHNKFLSVDPASHGWVNGEKLVVDQKLAVIRFRRVRILHLEKFGTRDPLWTIS